MRNRAQRKRRRSFDATPNRSLLLENSASWPGRKSLPDSPDAFAMCLKIKAKSWPPACLYACWLSGEGGDEMAVFFLTYAVLALLVVSLIGSAKAQMGKPRPKAGF